MNFPTIKLTITSACQTYRETMRCTDAEADAYEAQMASEGCKVTRKPIQRIETGFASEAEARRMMGAMSKAACPYFHGLIGDRFMVSWELK